MKLQYPVGWHIPEAAPLRHWVDSAHSNVAPAEQPVTNARTTETLTR
jgi:hypothetical protein